MLTLINGDGNPRVTAAQDADWYGSLTGEKTCIMPANDKFSATVADANTIEISSGVLITKEGRRVQVDAETIEEIIIPTGTQGTDTYYIIGFHLYIDESGQQVAETFVETMENESDTITETTFREGSTSIYISLYRVKRSGLTLESVTRICPMYELSADEIVYGNTNVGSELTQINQGLSEINTNLSARKTIYLQSAPTVQQLKDARSVTIICRGQTSSSNFPLRLYPELNVAISGYIWDGSQRWFASAGYTWSKINGTITLTGHEEQIASYGLDIIAGWILDF